MKGAMLRTLSRLARGAGLLYMGGLALALGLLSLWINVMGGQPGFSTQLGYLSQLLPLALPLFTMDAYARDRRLGVDLLLHCAPQGAARSDRGTALGYLIAQAAAAVPFVILVGAVSPDAVSFCALAGFFAAGCSLTCVCLMIAAHTPTRLSACLIGIAALAFLQNTPVIAGLARGLGAPGVWVGRALMRLSPATGLTAFLNGILDVGALLYDAALCALLLALIAPGSPWRAMRACGAFVLVAALLYIQPASVVRVDCTPQGAVTLSKHMATCLRGLNTDVTLYHVARVGTEDPWVADSLQKLSERHAFIRYVPVDPVQNAVISDMNLPDNSLIVENTIDWVVVKPDALYLSSPALTGRTDTFELEGALLFAISEATGLDLTYPEAPPGKVLTRAPITFSGARRALVISLLCSPALLIALYFAFAARARRNHARRENARLP